MAAGGQYKFFEELRPLSSVTKIDLLVKFSYFVFVSPQICNATVFIEPKHGIGLKPKRFINRTIGFV